MDERGLPAPGWYTDPTGEVRWWDGSAWTAHTAPHPAGSTAALPPRPAAPASPASPAPAAPSAPAPAAPVPTAPVGGAPMPPAPQAPLPPQPLAPAPLAPAAHALAAPLPPQAPQAPLAPQAPMAPLTPGGPAPLTPGAPAAQGAAFHPAEPAAPVYAATAYPPGHPLAAAAGAVPAPAAAGVLTLDRPVEAPLAEAVPPLPPMTDLVAEPSRLGSKGRGRSRRLSPWLVVAVLVALLGVAAYLVLPGLLGSEEEPAAAASSTSYKELSVPKGGVTGYTGVVNAEGAGSFTSPPFTLLGGKVAATLTQQGQGVAVQIFPATPSKDPKTTQSFQCGASCADSAWGSPVMPAGTYRAQVTADPGTTWTLQIRQVVAGTPSVVLTRTADGITQVTARGTGDGRTTVFRMKLGSQAEGPLVAGRMVVQGRAFAYLVPAGSRVDVERDLLHAQKSGSGAAFEARARAKAGASSGTYYLVVRANGGWSIRFTSG